MNSRLNPYQDDPCSNPYADEYAPPQAVSTTQQYSRIIGAKGFQKFQKKN